MLEQAIRRYYNRAIEVAQVIEELIGLIREMHEANARGGQLGLSEEELALISRYHDFRIGSLGGAGKGVIALSLCPPFTPSWGMK